MGMKQYTVVDLSSLLPGPFCSSLLSRFSFKILKIEDKRNADPLRQLWPTTNGVSVAYQALNKDKEIIEIDYKCEDDVEKLKTYIKKSDVLIENFRPGRMDKLSLGYEECLRINPTLVYCSISGFGQSHALSKKPAHDINILGLSGYLASGNCMTIPPIQIADIFTAYEASIQILASLLTSLPKKLDISMLSSLSLASNLTNTIEDHLKRPLSREEFILWGAYPCYHIYQTKDHKYMALGAIEPIFWQDFCTHIKREDLSEEQFNVKPTIIDGIQHQIASKTQKEWIDDDIDCFTPIYTYIESKQHGIVS